MYQKFLTKQEQEKIQEIKTKIKKSNSIKEIELYREQIGLILERIIIRKKCKLDKKF